MSSRAWCRPRRASRCSKSCGASTCIPWRWTRRRPLTPPARGAGSAAARRWRCGPATPARCSGPGYRSTGRSRSPPSTPGTTGWPRPSVKCAARCRRVRASATALTRPETRRRWHAARLTWPWIGDIELKYSTARFARTFGLLLKSGVPALPALKIARASATNLVVQEGVDRASAALTEGSALAPALAGTLPPLALQMIAVGEESGRLEELCLRVADTYDGEVRRALRTAVTLLEPALILVFGALVGFVALAMLQAIYGINLKAF